MNLTQLREPNEVPCNRREWITTSLAFSLATALSAQQRSAAEEARPPRILLRSSWQTVNIGDIAHTPGVLALLEKHFPAAEIRLWPSKIDNGVEELLLTRFPKLQIVKGAEMLRAAFAECDFLLHGSGPSLVAEHDCARWVKETSKPFGAYGITLAGQGSTATKPAPAEQIRATVALLSQAKFVFFRDSVSLEFAKQQGCDAPIMEFGPDGAFGTDLRDDARAIAFLREQELEEGKFLCCIPRLRYTPYWTIPSKKAAFDAKKQARNEAMQEHDHAPHREAICEVLKQTDLKILICPEDQTQMAVGKALLYDPLPEALKRRVVWRAEYWLTGEALSTYVRSAGLFGNEMHSPIMCIGNGIPAIVCRWSEQTSKGIMWRDIGLGDWLFNFDDEADVKRLVPTVLALAKDPAAAKAKAMQAREFVQERQRITMLAVKNNLKK